MKHSYEIKHIFTGSKEYKMPNGLSIRVKITVKEIKYDRRYNFILKDMVEAKYYLPS